MDRSAILARVLFAETVARHVKEQILSLPYPINGDQLVGWFEGELRLISGEQPVPLQWHVNKYDHMVILRGE